MGTVLVVFTYHKDQEKNEIANAMALKSPPGPKKAQKNEKACLLWYCLIAKPINKISNTRPFINSKQEIKTKKQRKPKD
jgi:hypothetical protein